VRAVLSVSTEAMVTSEPVPEVVGMAIKRALARKPKLSKGLRLWRSISGLS
jgi:hypothetical protein